MWRRCRQHRISAGIASGPADRARALHGLADRRRLEWYVIEHEQQQQPDARAAADLGEARDSGVAGRVPPWRSTARTYPAGTFFVHTSGSEADHAWLKALVERNGLNRGQRPQGLRRTQALRQPRVACTSRYSSPMNEGWLRLRLDDLKFPYTTLHNADIATPQERCRTIST